MQAFKHPGEIATLEHASPLQSADINPQHAEDNAIAAIWRVLNAAQIGQLKATGPEHIALCVVGEANSARHPQGKYDLYGDGWEVQLRSVDCTGVCADVLLGSPSGAPSHVTNKNQSLVYT